MFSGKVTEVFIECLDLRDSDSATVKWEHLLEGDLNDIIHMKFLSFSVVVLKTDMK